MFNLLSKVLLLWLLTLFAMCQLLEWVNNLYGRSFIFSLLCNSFFFPSCRLNFCNSFSFSCSFCFSLYLCAILLTHCLLLASISNASLNTSGYALNLQLCSASALPTTFILPLSRTGLLPSTVDDDAPLWDVVALCFANHSTSMMTVHWALRSDNIISMGLP